jgi:L-asparagine oxygenase
MFELTLTAGDRAALEPLIDSITERYESIEDPELIREARLLTHRLPDRLRQFLEQFRLTEPEAVCRVSGVDIEEARLGPTPQHWKGSQHGSAAFRQEVFFLLCAAALGDVFGWATQQQGRLMHDVLPIRGHENLEIGSNSLQPLSWHTEDAFHPCRGDYVALMCLKNPDLAETLVCAAPTLDWARLDVDALFEPEFTIMPDNSHQPASGWESSGNAEIDRLSAKSFATIEAWNKEPPTRPILSGDPADPYLALDPYHMDDAGWPNRHRQAFRGLCEEIEAKMDSVSLRPGDCVFIDNFRAVHGRKSFQPRYDGSDRWLKRLNITRNLRGSRGWRLSAAHRIIY